MTAIYLCSLSLFFTFAIAFIPIKQLIRSFLKEVYVRTIFPLYEAKKKVLYH